jgi:2-polyprenyl-3-methyl-5-hydroxy-6-metoxy-1,4-benzoquinol methylase
MHKRSAIRVFARMYSASKEQVRSTAASGSQVYESKRAVHEYLLFHYGRVEDHMPHKAGPVSALNFPTKCAQICVSNASGTGMHRALDIGCAVGASSFELARNFDEVIGIDFSSHFIEAANTIKAEGSMKFDVLVRGQVFKTCETALDQSIDRSKVQFQQGDACNLTSSLGKR